ncbi:MAG: hypothetical protein HY927_03340 [Elusimicrobia bacterium]|nr:hypothetical protein [Elusimicrobiota bacterium]
MEDANRKVILALAVPVAAFPAIFIVIIAFKFLMSGGGETVLSEAQALSKLASPRIETMVRSEAPGAIAPGAVLALDGLGNVFVGWARNIVEVRSRQPLLAAEDPGLSSFAATPEGMIMTVRGDRLGYVAAGSVVDKVALPSSQMRLERIAPDRMILYGPVSQKTWAVYLLAGGGSYTKLFTFPGEISAVAGAEGGMIFANSWGIYKAEFGKRISPVLYLPDKPGIRSLAYDAPHRAVFFSTADSVFLLIDGRVVKLLGNVSGTLRLGPEGLYILSETRQELLRVDNIFKP